VEPATDRKIALESEGGLSATPGGENQAQPQTLANGPAAREGNGFQKKLYHRGKRLRPTNAQGESGGANLRPERQRGLIGLFENGKGDCLKVIQKGGKSCAARGGDKWAATGEPSLLRRPEG